MIDRNEVGTPQWLFDYLDAEFHFDLDPCATPENAKCERFFTKEDDGLSQLWYSWGTTCAFVNPPYGRNLLYPWILHAINEAEIANFRSVHLLPSRTGRGWFDLCLGFATEVRFVVGGRIRFVAPAGVKYSSPREDSIIVVFGGRRPDWSVGKPSVTSVHLNLLKLGAKGNPRAR